MMADHQPSREPAVGQGPIRLVKLMADRALCSRRKASSSSNVSVISSRTRSGTPTGLKYGASGQQPILQAISLQAGNER